MQKTQPDRDLQFEHEQIDPDPPCERLSFCLTTDLTGNGRDDVIIGGMGATYPGKNYVIKAKKSRLPTFDRLRDRIHLDEVNLFWYENPGWERHSIAFAPLLDVGGALGDITGNGKIDIIAGQTIYRNDIYWFEQPDNPRQRWQQRLITDKFEKYHDICVGDVDDDGNLEVIGLSQKSGVLFYFDIPPRPEHEPWPESYLHIVDDDIDAEGLKLVDIDSDGKTEIIAGPNIYRRNETGTWDRDPIVTGWDYTRVEVGDIDNDGHPELVLTEGDSPEYGTHPGRLAIFDPIDPEPAVLEDDLFCPHSLQLADFNGNGRTDIYVSEMGLGSNDNPTHYIFCNVGDGTFVKTVISRGVETHEAKAVDLTGNGRPDIVGKSYMPDHHVDIWYNRS